MKHTISITYVLKWQLKNNTEYKFTENNICINTKTDNKIRMVVSGRSKGYCINGKFKSLNTLRKQLEPIPKTKLPF